MEHFLKEHWWRFWEKHFEGKYYVREWKKVADYGLGNFNRYISDYSLSRGAGSALIANWSDLFTGEDTIERAVLSKDYIIDKEKVVHRTEICVFRQQTPKIDEEFTWQESWLDRVVDASPPSDYEIFTDGAFDVKVDTMAMLLDHNVVNIADAAVVIAGKTDKWREEKIVAIRIMNDERIKADSAFPMELLALVAALRILDKVPGCTKILTDCQSAVKLLGTPSKLVKWSKKVNAALLKAAIKVGRGHLDKIEHVDSHPEERLHRSRWNRNDEGNFIADRVAVGDLEQLKEYNIELIVTSTYEVLESLSEIQTWFISSSSGVVNLCPLEKLVQETEGGKYLEARDVWRNKRICPIGPPGRHWANRTLNHAAIIWEMDVSKDSRSAARSQRICFDKHWHMWNQAKADPTLNTSCPHCKLPDSLGHLLTECQHERWKEVRQAGLDQVTEDLLNVDRDCREFAQLVHWFVNYDEDREQMYTGLWSEGLQRRFANEIQVLGQKINKQVLTKWRVILIMVGKTLTSAARDMVGLRFQDEDEPARHTAETFQDKIKNKRREEAKRKQGRKEERKKANNRKNKKMIEDGRRNKEPLREGERQRIREVDENGKDEVFVEICKF